MKGTLSKVLIVIGVILIVAAILWWAIAVNLLVKFPSDVNVTPIYEGDVDVYQDLLTGQLTKQATNFPLSIERHYESVSDEYDSSKAVVIESITQTVEVPLAPQKLVDTSQYVIDRKSIENVDDPRSWAFEPRFPVNRAGSYYLSFPMDLDKDKEYQIFENKVAGTYPMTKQADEDEQDLEGLKVYLFEGVLEPTKVTEDYLEYSNTKSPGQYPLTLSFDGLKAMIAADGVNIDPYLALLDATLTPEEMARLNEAISKPIELTYKFYTGGKVAIEPKTGSIIRLYDVTEGFMVEPEVNALFENLQTMLPSFAAAHPEQLKDATNQLFAQLAPLMEAEPNKIYEAHYSQTEASIKEAAQDAKDSIGMINWVKVYIPWILLIIGAAVLVGGLLMGGSPAPLEEGEAGESGDAGKDEEPGESPEE
jgi:hypothetical protein